VCTGSNPVLCTAAGQCRGVGTCNPSTGLCSDPPAPDGAPCDDGLFCTLDSCQGGVCTGTANDCDDGNACTTDSCDEGADMCVPTVITPCCGNGIIENFEECDEGTDNSDAPNSACRTDCTVPQCGNGVVDDLLGEECDEGASNSDAPNATCRLDCTDPRCGDGITDDQSGEQCDDGSGSAGDGCSPQCFAEPSATATLLPGKGNKTTDCMIEWKMENPTLDNQGRPAAQQRCADGDPSCDADGVINGQCVFDVWMCSNNSDPALPLCEPGQGPGGVGFVAVTEPKAPSARQALKTVDDAANRNALLQAAEAAKVGAAFDTCGPRMQIQVPLKSIVKKGRRKLKVRATSTKGVKDVDALLLICEPSLP
jgi:cysteine-rich repeat protein